MTAPEFLDFAINAAFGLVMLSVAIAFYRIARGPSLADRVVALDMMTITIMAFCGLYSIFDDSTAFVDVAIVVGLIGFLATVALARYAERMQDRRSRAAEAGPSSAEEAER